MSSAGEMPAQMFASRILEGRMSDQDIADRLREMSSQGDSLKDLMGMVSVFYAQSVRIATRHPMVMDLCGTGGAPVRTFNISTVSSFVVSAAGVPVAKHGNRSSIGRCGSADLLESIGADISPGVEACHRMLDRFGFTFLFAPGFHPAMRRVAKARRLVPRRTLFNVMGPLMNPVLGPRRQLMGVSDPSLLDIIPQALELLGVERAMVVHGLPGMDEVSLCGPTTVCDLRNGEFERYQLTPEELGFRTCAPGAVAEMAPQAAARACCEILRGKRGERRDAVLLNSACALLIAGKVPTLASGVSLAEMTIDSGRAFNRMREYIAASRGEVLC